MKAEDIKVRPALFEGWAVEIKGNTDSIYYFTDRKERAEKRRQELIDALPKRRWKYDDPQCRPLVLRDTKTQEYWAVPQPLVGLADRILEMLNEAEE